MTIIITNLNRWQPGLVEVMGIDAFEGYSVEVHMMPALDEEEVGRACVKCNIALPRWADWPVPMV